MFVKTSYTQRQMYWEVESEDRRRLAVDPDNPQCPFHDFIGNGRAVRRLGRAAYAALGNWHHNCKGQNFALIGPASSGKTTLARMFGKVVGLPFVEIHPVSVNSVNDVVIRIADVCDKTPVWCEDGLFTLELVLSRLNGTSDPPSYILPPMVIFVDEVGSLRPTILQGVLKATEKSDTVMVTEYQDLINCRDVCWIIAARDADELPDGFDTRFTNIDLELYTAEEIAQIIRIHNPDWGWEACESAARHGGRSPREAMAFAAEMVIEHQMSPGGWEEIALRVAPSPAGKRRP